jgi:hypothetical protein
MRFIPNKKGVPTTPEPAPAFKFDSVGGYQFYKHPDPAVYRLNKVLYDLRFSQDLRLRLFENTKAVATEYGLNEKEAAVLETMKDETIDAVRSLKPHPLVEAGAHPLGMWMSILVVQAEQRRLRAEKAKAAEQVKQ